MKAIVYGGKRNFIQFLSRIKGVDVVCREDIKDACSDAVKYDAVLFILPHYDKGENTVREFDSEEYSFAVKAVKNGNKIYMENYPSYDYRDCFVFGLQARGYVGSMGKNSICLSEKYSQGLGFEILQKQSGVFYRGEKHTEQKVEIIAEISNCLGVHNTVVKEERHEGIALMKSDDRIYCSLADITSLEDGHIFSYSHWRDFYSKLFGEVLSVSEEFVKQAFVASYKALSVANGDVNKDVKKAMRHSVAAALDWHERSGILVDEGRGGVYEMIRSFDLNIAKNVRGDSSLLTAALFMAAGKYFGKKRYEDIAENILDYVFDKCNFQITEGENRGLIKWFSGEYNVGTNYVYVSDTSRSGNSLLTIYKLTGDVKIKERVCLMGDALLRWFNGAPLFNTCAFNFEEDDLVTIRRLTKGQCAPEFYEAPLTFMKNLYFEFGDERYKDQVIKTAAALAKTYPNYENIASHSKNFTYSRLLGAFAAAESITQGIWTPIIDKLLEYFESCRHECGGFADGYAYFDKESTSRDMEFAVGFGRDDENIADIVYCQNTMLSALNTLCNCKSEGFNREKCSEMLDGLVDFLLRAQITSTDKKLSGGWMRAFDMENMEYYGCDKDFAWGPYCILTGWVSGAIPLVFLELLGREKD